MANTQFYILDQHSQPVPLGVIGELHIGGDGLARGYLGRPELTAEKFVPNPFITTKDERRKTKDEGEGIRPSSFVFRLYKTGDLARYLPNGTIELLGRADHQVKLRGYRIELGEIEVVLGQHPAVRACAVGVRNAGHGESQQLVAYVVAQGEPTPTELRQFIKESLPEYMLPSAFVFLETLPLTPNGKVDRRALSRELVERSKGEGLAPDGTRPELESVYVAPRNPTEALLARIWAERLNLERVGIHDNFFTLGGDSLLAVRVIAQAGQAGLRFSTKLLFQHQTIAELAQALQTAPELKAEQGVVVGPVPLTPILHWYFDLEVENPHLNNIAILFETPPGLDPTPLAPAVRQLLLHHDVLRTRFERGASGWLC